MDSFSWNSPASSMASSSYATPLSKDGHKMYTIQGIQVHFPFKAYPSQLAMMDKILKGLQRKENCLLESPTGSGKSVTLLCACLAWQLKEKDRIRKLNEEINAKFSYGEEECVEEERPSQVKADAEGSCVSVPQQNMSPQVTPSHSVTTSPYFGSANKNSTSGISKLNTEEIVISDDDDDDFQPAKRKKVSAVCQDKCSESGCYSYWISCSSCSNLKEALNELNASSIASIAQKESSSSNASSLPCNQNIKPEINPRDLILPKIYFGTRTHKQITQIVRELGRTAYKNAKMCILASRDRTCVHPDVSYSGNKNEKCRELLDHPRGPQCSYYLNARNVSQASLACSGTPSPWNIEDLVSFGKRSKACPYFGIRELMKDADIIFCPYNYLIDPLIRSTMEISLKANIVVLDEAHNIEDSAREAASWSVTQHELLTVKADLETYASSASTPQASHTKIASVLSGISNWIARNSENLDEFREFDRSGKVWSGLDFVAVLKDLQAGPDSYHTLERCFRDILSNDTDEEEQVTHTLTSSTVALIKQFQVVLRFLYYEDLKFMYDYKVAIVRTVDQHPKPLLSENGWLSTKNPHGWTYTLNLWCLNPAVAFSEFQGRIHSLIVTSGTLSPMVTFQSELNMPFSVQLEANHVIKDSQVWVGAIGNGPQGGVLNATFKFAETFAFQDEVGSVILQICKVVPHGVLCFFPSYSMLNKLMQRWQLTGLWKSLEQCKVILSEPRNFERVNLDSVISEFYQAVKDSKNGNRMSGALFLAVFRGKVSEGLDFADENARAVITVGIPFPNVKDIQVNLKRQYNNQYSSERSLLSGNQWYEIQAFRALNQALGRCIRHRDDWGALILIDDRFKKNTSYVKGLSKWVRNKLSRYDAFPSAFSSLKKFIHNKLANEENSQSSSILGVIPLLQESDSLRSDSPELFEW